MCAILNTGFLDRNIINEHGDIAYQPFMLKLPKMAYVQQVIFLCLMMAVAVPQLLKSTQLSDTSEMTLENLKGNTLPYPNLYSNQLCRESWISAHADMNKTHLK